VHNTNENNSWPTHKQEQFWKSCAAYVSQHSGQSARSDVACRVKVLKVLKTKYSKVEDAETAFGINYFEDVPQQSQDQDTGVAVSSPQPGEFFSSVLESIL